MTDKQLQKLFTPFSVADDDESKRKNPSGNGLGLSICQQIMKAMLGEIDVQTYRRFGTTFTVSFPTQIKIQPEATITEVLADIDLQDD